MAEPGPPVDGVEAVVAPPQLEVPRTPGQIARRLLQVLVGLGVAALLLGWGLPYLTQTSWETILGIVTGIGWVTFAQLLALMFLGLFSYTFTMTGSMPGLTHRQALVANLAGSGVSNVLPGGGAIGTVLTYAMYRSWHFAHRAISTSIVVTTVWNLLARVLLPVLAALVLLPAAQQVPTPMLRGAAVGGAGGALIAAALIAVISSRRAASAVGRAVDAMIRPVVRARRRSQPDGALPSTPSASRTQRHAVEELALQVRDTTIDVVRRRWPSLTFGLVGFMGVYFVLFRQCLVAVGVDLSWGHAFAAYAVGRLLTAVAVTPGGIGVAEAGSAAVMLAFGVPGDLTAAAVTLFALFSFLLEIPFGAIAAVIWLTTTDRHRT